MEKKLEQISVHMPAEYKEAIKLLADVNGADVSPFVMEEIIKPYLAHAVRKGSVLQKVGQLIENSQNCEILEK